MNKQERIKIYQETISLVNNEEYTSKNGIKNVIDNKSIENTKFYTNKVIINHTELEKYDTKIQVVNNDCLYEAEKLIERGFYPAVLNMASFYSPGGGVINGSSAQEENIFRRTNLFKSLYQFHPIGKDYGIEQQKEHYPLNYNYGGIYTPNVTVFRKSDDTNYELMDNPFKVDIITLAAVKRPKLNNKGEIVPQVKNVIENKIRQILDIAIENKNNALVLSAFGCGAYGTPPEEMAKLFADVLSSEDYIGAFKAIHFAIIETPSTSGEHNPNGNFKPFKNIFG